MPLRLLSGSVLASSVCPPGLCNQVWLFLLAFKTQVTARLLLDCPLAGEAGPPSSGLASSARHIIILQSSQRPLGDHGGLVEHQQRYLQVTCCLSSIVCCARGCS